MTVTWDHENVEIWKTDSKGGEREGDDDDRIMVPFLNKHLAGLPSFFGR